jgi:hypothetical protein
VFASVMPIQRVSTEWDADGARGSTVARLRDHRISKPATEKEARPCQV